MQQMTFAVACKNFFGYKQGQTTADFMAELRALTPQDKDDLRAMFPSVGIEIVEPKQVGGFPGDGVDSRETAEPSPAPPPDLSWVR